MRVGGWRDLRGRLWSLIAIALVLGVGAGAVLAAAAGARRTQTAYPRFISQSHESDVLVGIGCPPPAVAPCAPVHRAFHELVTSLPQVSSSASAPGLEVFPVSDRGRIDYNVRFVATNDQRIGRTIYLEKLFAGHYPNLNDPSAIGVNLPLALAHHYHVGQVLRDYRVFPGENRPFRASEGTPVTLRIAGIAIGQNEVLTDANTPSGLQILGTPAFYRAHSGSEAFAFEQVFLRHGTADLDRFRASMQGIFNKLPPGPTVFSDNTAGIPRVEDAIRPQTLALTLFAVVGGVAVLLVIGQALARQTSRDSTDYPVLHALGVTRRQLVAMAMSRAAAVGVLGAIVAVGVAVLASPLTPIGYGRIAEPDPGFAVNVAWLLVGAAVVVGAVLVVALPSALSSTRHLTVDTDYRARLGRTSLITNRLAKIGAPPTSLVGTQLALERGRGRTAVPVRTAIIGGAASIAVVAIVVTFGSNLDRLVGDPTRYGQNSDAVVDNAFYPIPLAAVQHAFPAAGVKSFAAGNFGDIRVNGRTVFAMGLDTPGSPGMTSSYLTVLAGRGASRPDEVALGETTMRQLHVHLGDRLVAAIGPSTHVLRVVGTVVFPAAPVGTTLRPELGDGAQLIAPLLAAPAPPGSPPGSIYTFFPVRFSAGNLTKHVASLRNGVDPEMACPLAPCVPTELQPATVRSYHSALTVKYLLIGFVGLLGLVAVGSAVAASIRRRRRDFAILEVMGFTGRQLLQTVVWQATTLAVVALVVGIPVGIALGRISWSSFAEGLGVGTDALVPLLALTLGAAIALVVVWAIAWSFYASLSASKPAIALRTE